MESHPLHRISLRVEELETRAAPSGLGHQVFLPQPAVIHAQGITTAQAAPANMHRADIIAVLIG